MIGEFPLTMNHVEILEIAQYYYSSHPKFPIFLTHQNHSLMFLIHCWIHSIHVNLEENLNIKLSQISFQARKVLLKLVRSGGNCLRLLFDNVSCCNRTRKPMSGKVVSLLYDKS